MEAPVVATDTWVQASWEHFLLLSCDPTYERAKFYYNHGWMCISNVLDGLTTTILEEALRLGSSEGDMVAMQYILDFLKNIDQ